MTLHDINDRHLRAHLAGEITVEQLQARLKGNEPYTVRDGQVFALTREEYARKMRAVHVPPVQPDFSQRPLAVPWCKWAKSTGALASGCARCKGYRSTCTNPSRSLKTCYSRKMPRQCGLFEPVQISVIMVARDEGDQVDATAASVAAAGATEIIIVDDGSCAPISVSSVQSGLSVPVPVRLKRHETPKGPAASRNAGARCAGGDVLVWMDAHMRVGPEDLVRLAYTACARRAIACAAVGPLAEDGTLSRAWTGYGGRLVLDDAGVAYKVDYLHRPTKDQRVTALIGACYAMHREVVDQVGGWPPTLGWGYNEQALSLAAHNAGVTIVVAPDVVAAHLFRKSFPYPAAASISRLNRFIVHWLLSEDWIWRTHWWPKLSGAFPTEAKRFRKLIEHDTDLQQARRHYAACRTVSDAEVSRLLGMTPCVTPPAKSPKVTAPLQVNYPAVPARDRIAVAVSTYPGHAPFLGAAIGSVDAQYPPPDERWLLCDRCDPPPRLPEHWQVIRGDWHSPSPGRNQVVERTAADAVAWLDADDCMQLGYVQAMREALANAEPSVGIFAPSLVYTDVHLGNPRPRTWPRHDFWALREYNTCPTPSTWLVKALREIHGWPEVMGHDDWGAALRLTRRGWTRVHVPDARIYVRRHDASRGRANQRTSACQWAAWECRTYAIVTLDAGREGLLPMRERVLDTLDVPPGTKLYVLDNSRNPDYRRRVWDMLRNRMGVVYDWRDTVPDPALGRNARNSHVCDLYNDILPGIDADYIVTWEDDVEPPPDALRSLCKAMPPLHHIGACAATYSPRGNPAMACAAFDMEHSFRHVLLRDLSDSPVDVVATGGGFTLFDHAALRRCLPVRYSFRANGSPIGWDGNLGLDLHRHGWRVLLHPGVRCEHHMEAPAVT